MAPALRSLDRIPFRTALALGLLLGLGVGFQALAAGNHGFAGAGLAVAGVVAALAALLAWSGEPLGIWEDELKDLLKMIALPGGTFVMGSPEDEPERRDIEVRHQVTVSPFLMSRTTVTRGDYKRIMDLDDAPGPGRAKHPVTEVTWFDAVRFCNRLSEEAGLEPCYEVENEEVSWINDSGGYRLPTEAEWEYAARAGTEGRWSFGDDQARLGDFAWFDDNSGNEAHPVAKKEPNPWGLYDMHGNVLEWCWDVFAEYDTGPAADPRGPKSGALRVLRGGSYWGGPWGLRSADRDGDGPVGRNGGIGFRCVRRPRRQH
ncbi:MAG: formylglycine-generating enzyme family protein [bacterium]|nr:formylglycine-generating enzyme family protein [bacterium]